MFLEKIILIIVCVSIFLFPKRLHSVLPQNFGTSSKKIHQLDVLIDKHITSLSEDNFLFKTSSFDQYGLGHLLDPYLIQVYSPLQRDKSEDVEKDFTHVFEKAITTYNHIPEIRPYLTCFPITAKEFDIWLLYGSPSTGYQKPPYFCFAANFCHKEEELKYLGFLKWTNPHQQSARFQPAVYKKRYDSIEGMQKYINRGIKREKNIVKKIILDKDFNRFEPYGYKGRLYSIVKKICSKHHFHISTLMHTAFGFREARELCVGLWGVNKSININEAQELSREFLNDLLVPLRKRHVMEKRFSGNSVVQESLKKNVNWISFRMTFWDEYLNRVEEPYIAQIQCQDGKLLYYTADEGQRLQQVFEEPIPDEFFPKKSQ